MFRGINITWNKSLSTLNKLKAVSQKQFPKDFSTSNNPGTVLKNLSSSPAKVIKHIESGWQSGRVEKSEEVFKEYIKAVAKLNKVDDLNLSGLLNLYTRANERVHHPKTSETAEHSSDHHRSYELHSPPPTPISLLTGSSSIGTSPNQPIYITNTPPSFRSQLLKFIGTMILLFILLSYFSGLLDEKGGGGGLSARLGMSTVIHQAENSDKTFDDVVGVDEAKSELEEIVYYLKDPTAFTRLGGKLPKGILLTGPPGTGKTLLARAIAGEAGVPFFYTSGSEFEEMFVGVGARRVRDLFNVAKNKSPCIIFIDEIDAIGGSRHLKEHSSMKMTLNQLLVEMDGFEQNTGVIVIAATNFAETLDSALMRPGRFDKHVEVPLPDVGGRKQILELYLSKVPLGDDVDIETLAKGTPGFSGADLYNLMNQAAVKASIDGLNAVNMKALEYAKDKILMGAERKSAILSPETMKLTAFHEAGHALIALKTDGADPVHKATIMPRGRALGMVMQLPDGDQTSMTRKQMLARLDVCMGGRVAEEIVFGADNVTSGASSDIQQATNLARAMVTKYGLSDKIGMIAIDDKLKLGDATQEEIDKEIRILLKDSYIRAKHILESNRGQLEKIAIGLLEYESLSGSEIVSLMSGKKINATMRSEKPSTSKSSYS